MLGTLLYIIVIIIVVIVIILLLKFLFQLFFVVPAFDGTEIITSYSPIQLQVLSWPLDYDTLISPS